MKTGVDAIGEALPIKPRVYAPPSMFGK